MAAPAPTARAANAEPTSPAVFHLVHNIGRVTPSAREITEIEADPATDNPSGSRAADRTVAPSGGSDTMTGAIPGRSASIQNRERYLQPGPISFRPTTR